MKKEIKNPETSVEDITWKQWKPIASVVRKSRRIKIQVLDKLSKID